MRLFKGISSIWIIVLVSCQSNDTLTGNFACCYNGLYGELYFKADSMFLVTGMETFSGWNKFTIKNDTIYHLTFTIPKPTKAKINFIDDNRFELKYAEDSTAMIFSRLQEPTNLERNINLYLKNFRKRRDALDCGY
ncbi:hypothetical protein Q2T40_12335 [Winogradskyella maritima]|uniref:DUF4369 domain-containing protein n=1 Tax=Winogradskyella maritima TaxID=1517766 RepID=A0ABV8AH84_9FLAO|nr:hypothetical protein [Winogradskyella maritima]